jgi:hypothetical protein
MGTEYRFYDYIDADGDGSNIIKGWLNDGGKDAKAYFTNIIPHLVATPPPWSTKYVTFMRREWKGFIELRKTGRSKTGRIQYRILGQIQNRDVYLVTYGIHKGKYFPTEVPPDKAAIRVSQMVNNPTRYRRKHEYD